MSQFDLFAASAIADPAVAERAEHVYRILSAARKSARVVSEEFIRHYESELRELES